MDSRVSRCSRRADQPGRDHERRDHHQRDHRHQPGQAEHGDQHQDQGQRVGHDRGQGRGNGLLRADDVAVQPADQGPGLGPGEEGDRLPLDVREHLGAQVVDQPLADPGRVPPLGEGQQRADQRETRHDRGHRDDDACVPRQDALVDEGLQQQRHRDHGHGGQRVHAQEQDEVPAVGPGVGHDPADRARLHPLPGDRGVTVKRAHRMPARTVHERGNLLATQDLPGSAEGERSVIRGDDPPDPPLAAPRRTSARRAPACGGPRLARATPRRRRSAPNAGSASTRLRRAPPPRRASRV